MLSLINSNFNLREGIDTNGHVINDIKSNNNKIIVFVSSDIFSEHKKQLDHW